MIQEKYVFREKKENVFDKHEWLRKWIDDYSEDTEHYCDMNFAYLHFDLDGKAAEEALNGGYFSVPYWLETCRDSNGDTIETQDDWLCQYIPTHFEPMKIGTVVAVSLDREKKREYEYIGSQTLPEEMEHQAEDGECVYEYRGYSFLRIFAPVDLSGGKLK